MSETALTSVSNLKLRSMVEDGVKKAELVIRVTDNPSKMLSAILIGNNVVNIGASALATVIATRLFGSKGVGIATGVITVLILVFGEITPKTYAKENCEKVSMTVAPIISFIMLVCTPFIFVLNKITGAIFAVIGMKEVSKPSVTESEFRTMVDMSHEEGVLETPEREMITNVVDFGNIDAEDVMVPRTDMVAIPHNISYEDAVNVFRTEKFSKLPVYTDTTDHIIGILNFRDIMLIEDTKGFKCEDYIKEPYFTYESKPCTELFAIMKANKLAMAVVLDEYGGTAGIVTLQDLIEEIVGDIIDDVRTDEEEIKPIRKNEYLVDGGTRIDDVNDTLGTELVCDDIETIGGYVLTLLGRFPVKGEVIDDKENSGIKFVVENMDKNRIELLKLEKLSAE
jgi:putative hemolysin